MRIASLLPSATEIVYALGLGEHLVAVSHDCDYPPDAKNKLRLTSIDVDPARATSRELNDWVAAKVHSRTSIYHIDAQLLKKANPDLILTQELCEVCAPSFNDVRSAVKILDGDPRILSLEPFSLGQILENILTVGEATRRLPEAKALVSSLQERISHVKELAREVKRRPKVFCIEWIGPVFVAGHWVPEIVQVAGGIDQLGPLHKPSVRLDWAQIANYSPDVIVLMPCGFNLERTVQEAKALESNQVWRKLRAVGEGQVFAVNGSAYFNRPGPRIVEGLEIMAEILHPEFFNGLAPAQSFLKIK